MAEPSTSRAQQRKRTEARILTAARDAFSVHGYDRTTIRAVAVAAQVNPGLVMHYFGSKENLFAQATSDSPDEPVAGRPDEVADALLAALHAKLTEEPAATLAMLRSMLTHPDAAEGVRENLHRQQRQLSASLQADDAILRTGLTGAVTLGVIIGRHLLRLDGLRDASPDEITALLRPTFENLVQPPAATDRAATEPE